MNKISEQTRREVIYRGQVQGVGFRYTTCRIAGQFQVTGFVRNLPNGCVQLVAEGGNDVLDNFTAEVAQVMSDYLSNYQEQSAEATGEFRDFEIRR